jgi:hypothetical protein
LAGQLLIYPLCRHAPNLPFGLPRAFVTDIHLPSALPLIRHFVTPSPRKRRGEGKMELDLFQLDQRSHKILRVQEQHWLSMCADFGGAVAEDASAGFDEVVAGG